MRDLQSQDEKKKETFKHQLDFLKKLDEKYNELLTETGEEAEIEITYKDDDLVVVKDKSVAVKKIEPFKNVYKWVKDWVNSNDPDKFVPQHTETEFEWLKNKVISLRKSEKVQEKQVKLFSKDDTVVLSKIEINIENLDAKLKEKDKYFNQLVSSINEVRKGMRHNV